jgi:hypothetical protein
MDQIPADRRNKIAETLRQRGGAKLPCPRCGGQSFQLLDGYFNQLISADLGSFQIGGPSIPSVVVACKQCGFLSQHALGVLGLLPEEAKAKDG